MKQHLKKHSLLFALPVLTVLVFGSIGTSNVFAENAIVDFVPDSVSSVKADSLLEVSGESPDRQSKISITGGTSGWAVIGNQAYPSNIEIVGDAVHKANGIWKISTSTATISVGDREDVPLELKGKAVDGKLRLHGTGTLGDDSFRIILRGHYAPIYDSPGEFVLDFSTAKVQNMETGLRIPLFQHGLIQVDSIPTVDPVVTDSNVEE